MATPPILPLFVDDYLGDTQHLSCEENGAYMLLLMAAWRSPDASLDNDDKKLARICRVGVRKWKTIRTALDEFWPVEDGRIFNRKLRKERAYVDQKSATNRKNADARWNKQTTENKQSRGKRPHSERNAPYPHSTTLPDGNVGDDGPNEPRIDPIEVIFNTGHQILENAGHDDRARRGRIIGRWRNQFGDDDRLIDALSRCIAMKPKEPISWMNANINPREPRNDYRPRYFRDEQEPSNSTVAATLDRKASRAAAKRPDPGDWAEDGTSIEGVARQPARIGASDD